MFIIHYKYSSDYIIVINAARAGETSPNALRPFFTLRIVGPRIFESTFRDHRAKKLDGALRKFTSFV